MRTILAMAAIAFLLPTTACASDRQHAGRFDDRQERVDIQDARRALQHAERLCGSPRHGRADARWGFDAARAQDRRFVSPGELRRDRAAVGTEHRDLRRALRSGDCSDIRRESRQLQAALLELREDTRDLRRR